MEEKMKDIREWFEPLKKEDVEEKIKLNLEKMNIELLREKLYEELFLHERKILEVERSLMLRRIQSQNLREQIKVVEDMIKIKHEGDKK